MRFMVSGTKDGGTIEVLVRKAADAVRYQKQLAAKGYVAMVVVTTRAAS